MLVEMGMCHGHFVLVVGCHSLGTTDVIGKCLCSIVCLLLVAYSALECRNYEYPMSLALGLASWNARWVHFVHLSVVEGISSR